ncbi:ALDH-like protein [Lizonia empirigonia]|nr:ALDH-like protein [Lizonia empirigonia]
MADSAIVALQATALTGRCDNAFFRQKQLKSLHDALRQDSNTIKDAIKSDTRVSEQEATTEVALALELVKEYYSSINQAKELEEEYRVANGKNASDQKQPRGVVYIEPAALAAGNCIALKLENNLRALPPLLHTVLSQALESDTFNIVSSAPSEEVLSSCLQVLQETQVQQPTYAQLVSPHSRVIAIVDRTADLAAAAEHLVTARFAFGGSSPYAPDLIFVNEYVKKEFLECVLKYAIPYLASSEEVLSNGSPRSPTLGAQKKGSRTVESLKFLESSNSWRPNVVTQGSNGAIVDLSNLSSLPLKASQPIFAVSAITSLEHAISLIDEDAESSTGLLAGCYFGTPSAGKYLSQFIKADVSLVNHIPYPLLLGPAAPAHHNVDIDALHKSAVLGGKGSRQASTNLLANAAQEIKEKKRAEWIAIGYFEQGILIGLGLYGVPLLACVGTGLVFGVRAGLRRFSLI